MHSFSRPCSATSSQSGISHSSTVASAAIACRICRRAGRRDVLDLKPNFLSILVGVNDTFFPKNRGETVEQYEQGYDKLLSETLAALPDVKIVLGQPFLLPVGKFKDNYTASLAELKKRQGVVDRLATKYHLSVVRYQDALDAACHRAPADHWTWDGVHPHYADHGLMAGSG